MNLTIRHFFFLLVLVISSNQLQGQLPWMDDFDGSNTNPFTISGPLCNGPGLNYWGVVCVNGGGCGNEINVAFNGSYANPMGSFLSGYDTDNANGCGGPGADDEWAQWTGIDVSTCSSPGTIYLCLDIAEGEEFAGAAGWDGPSIVSFSASIDGGGLMTLGTIEDQGQDTDPAFDLNCDFSGDPGNELTNVFTPYCFEIPAYGSSLLLRIDIDGLNEMLEDIAIDNVTIVCESNPANLPGNVLYFCGSCGTNLPPPTCDPTVICDGAGNLSHEEYDPATCGCIIVADPLPMCDPTVICDGAGNLSHEEFDAATCSCLSVADPLPMCDPTVVCDGAGNLSHQEIDPLTCGCVTIADPMPVCDPTVVCDGAGNLSHEEFDAASCGCLTVADPNPVCDPTVVCDGAGNLSHEEFDAASCSCVTVADPMPICDPTVVCDGAGNLSHEEFDAAASCGCIIVADPNPVCDPTVVCDGAGNLSHEEFDAASCGCIIVADPNPVCDPTVVCDGAGNLSHEEFDAASCACIIVADPNPVCDPTVVCDGAGNLSHEEFDAASCGCIIVADPNPVCDPTVICDGAGNLSHEEFDAASCGCIIVADPMPICNPNIVCDGAGNLSHEEFDATSCACIIVADPMPVCDPTVVCDGAGNLGHEEFNPALCACIIVADPTPICDPTVVCDGAGNLSHEEYDAASCACIIVADPMPICNPNIICDGAGNLSHEEFDAASCGCIIVADPMPICDPTVVCDGAGNLGHEEFDPALCACIIVADTNPVCDPTVVCDGAGNLSHEEFDPALCACIIVADPNPICDPSVVCDGAGNLSHEEFDAASCGCIIVADPMPICDPTVVCDGAGNLSHEEFDPASCSCITVADPTPICDMDPCTNGGTYFYQPALCQCIIDTPTIQGCTNPTADNYDPLANCDDGSCVSICPDLGNCNTDCTQGDIEIWNFTSCMCIVDIVTVNGCTDPTSCNYDPNANCDDGSCLPQPNCNTDICSGDTEIVDPNNPCGCILDVVQVLGCTDPTSCNYDPAANCDDGSCLPQPNCNTDICLGDTEIVDPNNACGCIVNVVQVLGCTDPTSCNYDPTANCDDGSCLPQPNCNTNICAGDTEIVDPNNPCGCILDVVQVLGCTDPTSCNYDPAANCDDGSCLPQPNCNTDICAGDTEIVDTNNPCGCILDEVQVFGCTNSTADNYDPTANCDDGSCMSTCPDLGNCNTDCTQGDVEIWDFNSCMCVVDVVTINGCTDPNACNYDPNATCDDGSCLPQPNCNTDICLGDTEIVDPNNPCGCILDEVQVLGCTDPAADNYDSNANCDDGSCMTTCPDPGSCNTDCTQGDIEVWDTANCLCVVDVITIIGCTDPNSCNYDPNANCDDGSCLPQPNCNTDICLGDTEIVDPNNPCGCILNELQILGCTDPAADNYDSNANCDDGSCMTTCQDPGTCNTDCTQGDLEVWDIASCSCIVDVVTVNGCTDPNACNYNPNATCDDGSCLPQPNCNTDICLGDTEIVDPNNPCGCILDEVQIFGCTNTTADNYDPNANCDDGSCTSTCPDLGNCNTDCTQGDLEIWDFNSCMCVVDVITMNGCTDPNACNYNPNANCDDGSCLPQLNCNTDVCLGDTEIVDPNNPCGCILDEVQVLGCTDPAADNYDSNSNCDDGSCVTTCPDLGNCNTDCTQGDLEIWDFANCMCVVDVVTINGCTDQNACNYNPNANCDDGSCLPQPNCNTDICIGDTEIVDPNNPCGCILDEVQVLGCTDPNADNYDSNANCDDGSCVTSCPDLGNCNTDCTQGDLEIWDFANCMCVVDVVTINGCTDPSACNYDPNATCNDGSCLPQPNCNTDICLGDTEVVDPNNPCGCILDEVQVLGCTDPTSANYNQSANCDDGSCSTCNIVSFIPDPPQPLSCQSFDVGIMLEVAGSSTGSTIDYEWIYLNNSIGTGPAITVFEEGIYTLIVSDNASGCADTSFVNIEMPMVNFNSQIEINPETCPGETDGSIIIGNVMGGEPPYLYALNSANFGTENFFLNLSPGNQTILIQDADGCEFALDIEIPGSNLSIVDLGEDQTINLGDSLTLFANTTMNNIDTIIWEGPIDDFSCTDCLNPMVSPITETTYRVTIIDENGCALTDEIVLFVNRARQIYVPNAFSPNGDGANDEFFIFAGSGVARINNFHIYDRWGVTVFTASDIAPNDPLAGWDGTYGGKIANPGVFVYFAELEFADGRIEIIRGDVALLR